ncbi:MAG: NHLP bacteriocin export ABC transporter permease/ATPase subunit [Micromonosporaceae bacterium]|nr:NHLP bacteriocin export ABC transporter permease/ATPase subunit [Micromonosporaceae bacterium]
MTSDRTGDSAVSWGRQDVLALDDPDRGWVVAEGCVDVYVTDADREGPGRRGYLCTVEQGQAFVGGPLARDDGVRLIAVPTWGTQARPFTRAEARGAPDLINLVSGWIAKIVDATAAAEARIRERHDGQAPPAATPGTLAPGDVELQPDTAMSLAPECGVCWVVPDRPVDVSWPSLGQITAGLPVTPQMILSAPGRARLRITPAARALSDPEAWDGVTALLAAVVTAYRELSRVTAAHDGDLMVERVVRAERQRNAGVSALITTCLDGEPAEPPPLDPTEAPVLWVCRRVGEALGSPIVAPSRTAALPATGRSVRVIAQASRLRYRAVTLESGWWQEESGPIIAFRRVDGAPVALLPVTGRGHRRYRAVAPGTPAALVDAEVAGTLVPQAYVLYRRVPPEVVGLRSLGRFGLSGTGAEWIRVAVLAAVIGLLGLAVPLGTSSVVGSAIPVGDRSMLLVVVGALILANLAIGLFTVSRDLTVGRLISMISNPVEIAVWDRLLALPTRFFQRFSSGDLVSRATGIDLLRQTLAASVPQSIVGGLGALFALGLLMYYAVPLAIMVLCWVTAVLAVTALALRRHIRLARRLSARQAEANGLMVQFLDGITKLRIAAAEDRAFAVWSETYGRQRLLSDQLTRAQHALGTFLAVVPNCSLVAFFCTVAILGVGAVDPASFLGAQAALGQLIGAVVGVATAMGAVAAAQPLLERVASIVEETPECGPDHADPGALSGRIEINDVVFRYEPDAPPVLDGVALTIAPGEFVALVGESGCGKSTLMRLLLGFERPESGSILFDSQDLETLDVEAVRRQVGTVLQDGTITAGTILSNIIGNSDLRLDEAWTAAERAGLAEDIRAMPMGMFTSTGSQALFSGGQRQRMLIARALALHPTILILDEATSALDNVTQQVVSDSLCALGVTRIAVAHRLTTVVEADRILVLANGRIVQSGTYAELMAVDGPFRDLARRQLASTDSTASTVVNARMERAANRRPQ